MNTAFIFYDTETDSVINFDYTMNGIVIFKYRPEAIQPFDECLFSTEHQIDMLVRLAKVDEWPREHIKKENLIIFKIKFDEKTVHMDFSDAVWSGKE